MNGTEYRNGAFVVLDIEDSGYLFGKIQFVICENERKPLLVTTLYSTVEFDHRSYCYIVYHKIPSETHICEVHNLIDPIPIDRVQKNRNYVRLKYHVFGKCT